MQAELNKFLQTKDKMYNSIRYINQKKELNFFRWFCHFDDDQYVNVIVLFETLWLLDVQKDWYIGKASTNTAVKLKVNLLV